VNPNYVRLTLILGLVLGLLAVARLLAWPLARVSLSPSAVAEVGRGVPEAVRRVGAESVNAIVSRDPFRIGRRPALLPYDPLRLAEQLAPPPQRPALIVVGVVTGAEPSAVIEGLPGVEGSRVMRVGDVVAGLQVKQIGNGRVVIAGMDTTWVLEVREPWKN